MFISSGAGSLSKLQVREPLSENFMYGSSKSAVNYLTIHYARKYPEWKVNSVCPGLRATKASGVDLNDETDPAKGAVRVLELIKEGKDGVTGTYSNSEGPIQW
jgi:NAD(P)-dependent dehydrogenase (short-subunit alcohol dehydrogenase family)